MLEALFLYGDPLAYTCVYLHTEHVYRERALTRVPISDAMVWQRRAVHAGPCPVEQVRAGRH
jgi:hypothetical protein